MTTFTQSLLAGGLAGTSVDLLFFPIDTIKTRLQSSVGLSSYKGIYKGVGIVCIGSAPGAAAFFSSYELLKQTLATHTNSRAANHVLSASMAEVVACLVRVPTEVVKSRAQTDMSSKGAGVGRASIGAARDVWRHHGITGFYRGFGSTVMREIPFTSIQFPLYEQLKEMTRIRLDKQQLHAYEAAICGSIAGGIAAFLTTPLDVLKTRVMLDKKKVKTPVITHLRTIFRTDTKLLWSGAIPRTIWISAGGAVFLGVYEWGINGLTRRNL